MVRSSLTLPPPDAIRRTAQEVVARPDYNLESRVLSNEPPLWIELARWLLKPFQWLFESMEGVPDFFRWIVVILAGLVCVALVAHILYTLISAIHGPVQRRGLAYESVAKEVDPSELESEANRSGNRGDYIGAIRLMFRASLRRIELAERRKFRPGFTNRELLRRYRASPLFASLEEFVETIESKWYGNSPCEPGDYAACRGAHDRICQHIRNSGPALGP